MHRSIPPSSSTPQASVAAAASPAARAPAAPTSASGPIRAQYQALGVDGFYSHHGAQYRNPHFAGVRSCLRTLLAKWTSLNGQVAYPVFPSPSLGDEDSSQSEDNKRCWHMLDLAAGSGEATQVVNEWRADMERNQALSSHLPSRILWSAFDPYTQEAYMARIGQPCAPISFQDIAAGALDAADDSADEDQGNPALPASWDLVVCSFALHLIDVSLLFGVLEPLARRSRFLMVLSPSKKPEIKPNTGWHMLAEAYTGGSANNRVHGWLFESQLCPE